MEIVRSVCPERPVPHILVGEAGGGVVDVVHRGRLGVKGAAKPQRDKGPLAGQQGLELVHQRLPRPSVGGGLDLVETKAVSVRAYKWFFEGDFSNDKNSADDTVEVVADDFECSAAL